MAPKGLILYFEQTDDKNVNRAIYNFQEASGSSWKWRTNSFLPSPLRTSLIPSPLTTSLASPLRTSLIPSPLRISALSDSLFRYSQRYSFTL